jgi:Ca2+-binding EF-hand superfamily protein
MAMTTWNRLKFIVPLAAYLLATFMLATYFTGEAAWRVQILVLAGLSLVSNIFVLHYHYTHPPHPKFLMLPRRRLALMVHLISGSVELYGAILAYLSESPVLGVAVALTALLAHIPTSIYQIPIVFGSKAVMTPGYVFVMALHGYCALHLLANPASRYWLVNTFLALNTYVWCRVFYVILERLDVFPGSLYTVSILFSGFLTFPAIMGPLAPFVLMGFVFLYIAEVKWLRHPSKEEYRSFVREYAKRTLIDPNAKALWMTDRLREAGVDDPVGRDQADEALARKVFDRLDRDKSGALSEQEMRNILLDFKLPKDYVQAFVRQYGRNGAFDFPTFYRHLWQLQPIHHRFCKPLDPGRKYAEQEQADFVFDQIDIDRSGSLEAFEIKMLLIEWGLPEQEVLEYVRLFDVNRDGRISREEFRRHFRPIWRYCFHEIQRGGMRV